MVKKHSEEENTDNEEYEAPAALKKDVNRNPFNFQSNAPYNSMAAVPTQSSVAQRLLPEELRTLNKSEVTFFIDKMP